MGMGKFRPPELKNPRTDLDETWNILLRRGIITHANPCGGATVRQRGWSRRMLDTSPTRHFAYWTLRLLRGQFAHSMWTQENENVWHTLCYKKTRAQQLLRWATLATIDMGLKGRGVLCPFPGALRTRLIQCGLHGGLLPYQVASSSIQPFGHNSVGCHYVCCRNAYSNSTLRWCSVSSKNATVLTVINLLNFTIKVVQILHQNSYCTCIVLSKMQLICETLFPPRIRDDLLYIADSQSTP